jgi:stage III sporulation protein AA
VCEEIRIRCGRMSFVTMSGGINVPLDVSLSRDEMDQTIEKLCRGSLYAYTETINQGYITLPYGMRAGISGRAAVENGRVIGVSDINGICIRIPHYVKADPAPICNLLRELDMNRGVLLYSAPGVGKTTILRSVSSEMAKGNNACRVVVVDTRGELEFGLRSRGLCLDILCGYPKSLGIEIALRSMGAQLIVCDEIGGTDEITSICNAANGGAALLASVHASDIESLMSNESVKMLHKAGAFGAYVGIKRFEREFRYTVTYRGDIA